MKTIFLERYRNAASHISSFHKTLLACIKVFRMLMSPTVDMNFDENGVELSPCQWCIPRGAKVAGKVPKQLKALTAAPIFKTLKQNMKELKKELLIVKYQTDGMNV